MMLARSGRHEIIFMNKYLLSSKAQSIYLSGVVNRSLSRSLSKTQSGRFLLNFGVRKKIKKSKIIEKYFSWGLFTILL